jgi:hypothetical protein
MDTTLTEKALVQRLNRHLIKDWEKIRKVRPGRYEFELGDYYIIDVYRNLILEKNLNTYDLVEMAEERFGKKFIVKDL